MKKGGYILGAIFIGVIIAIVVVFMVMRNGENNGTNDNGLSSGESDDSGTIIDINGIEISTFCIENIHCILVRDDLNYSTCFPGICEGIDYSLDIWIAVNGVDFVAFRESVEPKNCGAPPGCPVPYFNDSYMAQCDNNLCEKVLRNLVP